MTRPPASIIEHVNNPRNAGELPDADAVGRASLSGSAPRCEFFIRIDGDRVSEARFQAFGCGYSIASCSMLTELVTGESIEQCTCLTPGDVEQALGGLPSNKRFCCEIAIAALKDALRQVDQADHFPSGH